MRPDMTVTQRARQNTHGSSVEIRLYARSMAEDGRRAFAFKQTRQLLVDARMLSKPGRFAPHGCAMRSAAHESDLDSNVLRLQRRRRRLVEIPHRVRGGRKNYPTNDQRFVGRRPLLMLGLSSQLVAERAIGTNDVVLCGKRVFARVLVLRLLILRISRSTGV